jgi:hypothetical protein
MRLLALLVCSVACASETVVPTVASNPFVPRWITPAGDTLALREDLRIGVMDGPTEYTLVYVTDVVVDSSGRIYTFDTGNGTGQQIRQYTAQGKFIRNFGGGGAGPGEYGAWIDIALLSGGDLLVADANSLARFTRFTPDGELKHIYDNRMGAPGRDIIMPTPNGGWIWEIAWPSNQPEERGAFAFVSHDSFGNVTDTIPPAPEHVAIARHRMTDQAEEFGKTFQSPLPDGALVTASSKSADLVIRRGRAVDTITRSVPMQRYTELERTGLLSQYRAAARRAGQDPAKMELSEFKPAYRWVGTLDSGQIFTWMYGPVFPYDDSERGDRARGFRGIRVTDLLEGDGKWIGRLLEVTPYVFKADTIWGTAQTDEGVQYVGRWVIGS